MMEEEEEEVCCSSLTAREGSKLDQGVVGDPGTNEPNSEYCQDTVHRFIIYTLFSLFLYYMVNWEPLIDYCTSKPCKCNHFEVMVVIPKSNW